MISDYFKIAIKNLKQRKLRSWLTMLGIFISIATIFTLISLSLGLQGAINEQFQILGVDKFFIMPKGQLGAPGTGGAVELTLKDVNVVEKTSGVKDVTYATVANAKVEFNKQTRYMMVVGLPTDKIELFKESTSLKIEDGKFIEKSVTGKIVLGYDYKYGNIFGKPIIVGEIILINGQKFRVIGILGQIGNPQDDKNIYMSIDDVKSVFNTRDRIDEIIIQINYGENIKDVANKVEDKLRKSRGVTEKTQDFSVLTPEELLQSFGNILTIITAFLGGIAAISLIVGGVGITNTMYTSVIERTKEIGIMKAIGAKNKDILWIFLIESGLLGLAGAIIGVVLGYGLSNGIVYIVTNLYNTNLLQAAAPIYLIAGCLAFGFLIGAISGVLPAWQASKTNVVDALRYE
ncbi:MAG: FtsX-like permease family protein [Candidatus Pacearchaeota archaeon]